MAIIVFVGEHEARIWILHRLAVQIFLCGTDVPEWRDTQRRGLLRQPVEAESLNMKSNVREFGEPVLCVYAPVGMCVRVCVHVSSRSTVFALKPGLKAPRGQ